nr:tannase/feruloyl esterase family alpha/beta hydrolase [Sphingomonas sp. CDS-1]
MSYYADGALDADKIKLAPSGFTRWVDTSSFQPVDLDDRCSVDFLQAALSHLPDVKIVSAKVNRSGQFAPPPSHLVPDYAPAPSLITDLPPFCQILAIQRTAGGHVAHMPIWVPLAWNGRFLATGGMGSITGPIWFEQPAVRTVTMPIALRNGFATAATDAGNRDPRFFDWPLDPKNGALDWDLLRNWSYRGTHDMAVVAKAVTQALHGKAPFRSYYAGCSGGGRQGVAVALRHPEDFDGIWASDAAVNWTSLWPSAMWPALVMKEYGTVLPPAKFEAFRDAALEACDGADGVRDGFIGLAELRTFDAHSVVGRQTLAGPITAIDAEIMQKLWDGPRRANGERLGYGLPVGTESWGAVGIWKSVDIEGRLEPVCYESQAYYRWILEDPKFDWKTLSLERYEALTDLGFAKFEDIATNDPDLSALRDCGGKLLLTQAVNDQVVPYDSVVDYYRRVVVTCGGAAQTGSFARLFCTDGDIHGTIAGPGPGLTTASAMTALMAWVEQGEAPEEIIAERVDVTTGQVVAARPTYPYPTVTRYKGSGDPAAASSYVASLKSCR